MRTALGILLLFFSFSFSQEAHKDPRVSITFNIVDIMAYSVEAEGYIKPNKQANTYLTPGVGFGSVPFHNWYWGDFMGLVPHHVTVNWGFTQQHHFLETGYKGLYSFSSSSQAYYLGALLGYRYHAKHNAFIYKMFVAPGVVFSSNEAQFVPHFGFAFGARF